MWRWADATSTYWTQQFNRPKGCYDKYRGWVRGRQSPRRASTTRGDNSVGLRTTMKANQELQLRRRCGTQIHANIFDSPRPFWFIVPCGATGAMHKRNVARNRRTFAKCEAKDNSRENQAYRRNVRSRASDVTAVRAAHSKQK